MQNVECRLDAHSDKLNSIKMEVPALSFVFGLGRMDRMDSDSRPFSVSAFTPRGVHGGQIGCRGTIAVALTLCQQSWRATASAPAISGPDS